MRKRDGFTRHHLAHEFSNVRIDFVFSPVIARQSGFLKFMPSVSIVPIEEEEKRDKEKEETKEEDDDTVSNERDRRRKIELR